MPSVIEAAPPREASAADGSETVVRAPACQPTTTPTTSVAAPTAIAHFSDLAAGVSRGRGRTDRTRGARAGDRTGRARRPRSGGD